MAALLFPPGPPVSKHALKMELGCARRRAGTLIHLPLSSQRSLARPFFPFLFFSLFLPLAANQQAPVGNRILETRVEAGLSNH